jgi:hypothetical protein
MASTLAGFTAVVGLVDVPELSVLRAHPANTSAADAAMAAATRHRRDFPGPFGHPPSTIASFSTQHALPVTEQ